MNIFTFGGTPNPIFYIPSQFVSGIQRNCTSHKEKRWRYQEMAKRLNGSFGLIHWRGKKLFNAPTRRKILLTLLLVNNNPQIIRTNVKIKRMKDFVKKIEDLSSLGEDKKGGKGVAQVAGTTPYGHLLPFATGRGTAFSEEI